MRKHNDFLKEILEDSFNIIDTGRNCVSYELDNERIAEMRLTGQMNGSFNSITVSIKHKMNGNLTENVFDFIKNLSIYNHSEKGLIWYNCKPTSDDFNEISQEIASYIGLWLK